MKTMLFADGGQGGNRKKDIVVGRTKKTPIIIDRGFDVRSINDNVIFLSCNPGADGISACAVFEKMNKGNTGFWRCRNRKGKAQVLIPVIDGEVGIQLINGAEIGIVTTVRFGKPVQYRNIPGS